MNIWERLSTKTKERIICAAGYVAWIVVFWFLSNKVLMTPATAFFGLAALTAVYAGLYIGLKSMFQSKGI